MDSLVPFYFRSQLCSVEAYFSFDKEPCYIFLSLRDRDLIQEFGEDITIKTDCVRVLPRKDDNAELIRLRQAIFEAFKTTRAFPLANASRKPARNSPTINAVK
jgi:hypothetical protein